MARPAGRPIAARGVTVCDVREQFLARGGASNLSPRTVEWYGDRTGRFTAWWLARSVERAADLTVGDVDGFLIELREGGFASRNGERLRPGGQKPCAASATATAS